MLGLAYQGQGQLDMACDKFRKCPVDDAVMDNLYNLALDFERKRQFNKAEIVFRYMAEHNPKFRDLEQKLSRAKQLSETVILGGGSSHPGGTSILDRRPVEKPMLGRYQVREGARQGRDGRGLPGQGSEDRPRGGDQDHGAGAGVRGRRAGRGEGALLPRGGDRGAPVAPEHRHHLRRRRGARPRATSRWSSSRAATWCRTPSRATCCRPTRWCRSSRASADALGYAHKQNVVHRDIKPANIMYEPETDTVKVTDFGIARITDSSKTKTGMVLGTPSYMSPEQLAGKKIDGRSDLFSLARRACTSCCAAGCRSRASRWRS